MTHSTVFEATQGGLALTNAILLYRPQGKAAQPGQSIPVNEMGTRWTLCDRIMREGGR